MRITNSRIHQFLFPSFTYRTGSSSVHLTFDDGPHPQATLSILDVLETRAVKATFFLLGKNVLAYPSIAREIVSRGHTIGNHSYDHPLMIFRSRQFIMGQIKQAEDAIVSATSFKPKLFRPPYGFVDQWTAKIARQMGYEIVMWTTDPADFKFTETTTIVRRITSRASNGSIILMHDNEATAHHVRDILTGVLDDLTFRGFSLSALPS